MEVIYSRCCGLDIHQRTVVACLRLRADDGQVHQEVQTFGTMTADLLILADWLAAHQVTHVAMESTGVYWWPVYNVLEAEFTVLLVNATHLKAVPGRKTDVKDSEWIAELLAHGLLRGSFIPPQPIRDLRDFTRYRRALIDDRVRLVNRLHKLLESANIKLAVVATDILGASGRAMLLALLEGRTDPAGLADLAKGRLRQKLPALRQALEGRFREHHRFLLAEMLSHLEAVDEAIARLSAEIIRQTAAFAPLLDLLTTIPGVQRKTAETILAEIGGDMGRFPTHRHLASWAGVCPGQHVSAGKRKSGRVRPGNPWLRRVLVETAWAASRRRGTYMAAQYQRLARRRGKKKAVMAVAHSLLVIAYHVLKARVPYRELGADYFEQRDEARTRQRYLRRLEKLGFKVTLAPRENAK
jgi:transposase